MTGKPWFADPELRQFRSDLQKQKVHNILVQVVSECPNLKVEGEPLAWGDRIELTYRIRCMDTAVGHDPILYIPGPSKPMTDVELQQHFGMHLRIGLEKGKPSS